MAQCIFYIQDIIVAPSYQKQGIGRLVMTHIENYLTNTCSNGATVGLLSAHGKESFYTHYGYVKRDGDVLGLGMCKFISR
ncbi:GNAT family N-acetyltransferase [Pseudoalteromonas sp. P1-25]|uniref:GNAT family N-acetyltransferase n=1 Tax=Pseudoalteromonas sp. P1-25 TaxID=1723758 RepID=UPI0006E61DC5|nr:Acetyltransferase (GNAT) family protein [Pseudoalteromonas sp. P1-25]